MIFKMTIRCMIAATVAMLTGCASVTHVTEPEAKRVLVEFFRNVDFTPWPCRNGPKTSGK